MFHRVSLCAIFKGCLVSLNEGFMKKKRDKTVFLSPDTDTRRHFGSWLLPGAFVPVPTHASYKRHQPFIPQRINDALLLLLSIFLFTSPSSVALFLIESQIACTPHAWELDVLQLFGDRDTIFVGQAELFPAFFLVVKFNG
jgi:hypothetical protein